MNSKLYRVRLATVQAIRRFFETRGFLEVETPILAGSVIPESNIALFNTTQEHPNGEQKLYLLPSPEYYMKQLLAQNWGSIFQFARCFRNAEIPSHLHSHEFTMLEYYWVNHNYLDSMMLTEELLKSLISAHANFEELRFKKISMEEAFQGSTGLSLGRLCTEGGQAGDSDTSAMRTACHSLGISCKDSDSWEVLFNRIFLNCVEPQIVSKRPSEAVFLYDYPARLQSLSQNKEPWTERWELYWQGVELANCYSEELSREGIEGFFAHELSAMGRSSDRVNADLQFASKTEGMPECSGTAIGLDRLVMLLTGAKSIHEVMPFQAG